MATTSRPTRPRKAPNEPTRRSPAWSGPRASPTFSPAPHTNGRVNPSPPVDQALQSLAGLTGTTVTLSTKTAQRFEGVVASTAPEGDTPGVTLKDAKDILTPGAPLKDHLFIASTNIESWSSGPVSSKPPVDSFRTDKEISQKSVPRERELQQWSAGSDAPGNTPLDDDTFSSHHTSWDQFAVNEKLFGVKTQFDENLYTTKLDRSGSDYKERERHAQRLANEIINSGTSNPHIAEERNLIVDDTGADEETKYGAVIRGANAYIPPPARKHATNSGPVVTEVPKVSVNGPDAAGSAMKTQSQSPTKVASPSPSAPKPADDPVLPAFREFVTSEKQRLTQKRQALAKNDMEKRMAELVKFSQSFKLNKPIPDDLVPILAKDEEKQRAIREKSTKDAASAHARSIGCAPPANAASARGTQATVGKVGAEPRRPILTPGPKTPTNGFQSQQSSVQKQSATAKPTNPSEVAGKMHAMYIQPIPPFKGKNRQQAAVVPTPAVNGTAKITSNPPGASSASNNTSPQATNNRLNVNASSFKPNARASTFTPGSSASSNTATAQQNASNTKPKSDPSPNPFFGTRPIKKSTPVNIKDDFNPFKHGKVPEPIQVGVIWPYNGKRFSLVFPAPQHPTQHSQPHNMPPPAPPPIPPPSYEEDSASQAAARGYVYAYPPYGYPAQPMMPGLAPPGPPGGYMPGPYMPPMQYSPGMAPPAAMYSPGMGQIPPPAAYMHPPPGYPPPNGSGPRPSMPPTPIPSHAHPYYHQSPQLQHAVPYHMMMPHPPNVHPYDGGPAPPVQMSGHA